MKKFRLINLVLVLMTIMFITSCMDDDNEIDKVYRSWGFITHVDGNRYEVKTDLDNVVFISNLSSSKIDFNIGDRVYLEFFILNTPENFVLPDGFDDFDLYVNLIRIYKFDYFDIVEVTDENKESLGKEFIGLNGCFVSKVSLNVSMFFNGYKNEESVINLCYDPKNQVSESNVVILELRRAVSGGDGNEMYQYTSLESFDLKNLLQWGTKDKEGYIEFKVRINSESDNNKRTTDVMKVKFPEINED